MKIILTILFATTLVTTTPDLVGIYEYKSVNKSENHYIIFDRIDGEMKGKYFGTHDGKEHGVFFFKADIEKLEIRDKGEIEFEIGDRLLYESTQFKIKDPSPDSTVGRTSDILRYKGRITADKLKLTCDSDAYDCWDKELTFDKISSAHKKND